MSEKQVTPGSPQDFLLMAIGVLIAWGVFNIIF